MATYPNSLRTYPETTAAPVLKRPVFGDAPRTNIERPAEAGAAALQKEKGKEIAPPEPRQTGKVIPPSPPEIIRDSTRSLAFARVGFLGEGGFARVYEVKDARGGRHAVKVVSKESLKTKKAKTKLYAEIKIHRSLRHPNIVHFEECFEDPDNVYMTLELCESGSLMDLLRRRKRFIEPESRFFMVQLIGACHYMHTHQVIHRDLKLGNLFLDGNMNVKVGDFGLAALIESPGERKKTICGTPNYIAPEVLFDTANGHSFEVDTWSIGVILYTFLVGKPPFQTKDVKTIYKRIRDNQYDFPTDRAVSSESRDLISQILTRDPQDRPTLHEILEHPFFTSGTVPSYIPSSAHDSPPDFRYITASASKINLARLRKEALLDDDHSASDLNVAVLNSTAGSKSQLTLGPTIEQQEREFQKAVQPGSPISALLSSARQPLLVSASSSREPSLLRKLTAASVSAKEAKSGARATLTDIQEEGSNSPSGTGKRDELESNEVVRRKGGRDESVKDSRARLAESQNVRTLESQKARLVARMAALPPAASSHFPMDDNENAPVPIPMYKEPKSLKHSVRSQNSIAQVPNATADMNPKTNTFDIMESTLRSAFEAKQANKVFRDPSLDVDLPDATVFIVSWVDYCDKYGMGYALTDGTVGVHFNDSTSLVLSPDKYHFDYISSRRQGSVYVRKNHDVKTFPPELKSKVYLLNHFERYMMDRLYGDHEFTFEDKDRLKGMDFVQKYLRMKHVIVFKLSHDVLQFNFYDHSKIILSSKGLVVTHIDKHYKLTRWRLSEIMARSLKPPLADADQQKFNEKLITKLRFCKEVVTSIRVANTTDGAGIGTSTGTIPIVAIKTRSDELVGNTGDSETVPLSRTGYPSRYDAGSARSAPAQPSKVAVR